ncbi:phosphate ABC transporter permease subunit PstC, partial [Bacillus cereus]|nr:phosphate ABC transporter permease subunit PstC [Bacillus cereus]
KSQITFSVQHLIERNTKKTKKTQRINRIVTLLLKIIASLSIVTTLGIVFTLSNETIMFFQKISLYYFLMEKEWLQV